MLIGSNEYKMTKRCFFNKLAFGYPFCMFFKNGIYLFFGRDNFCFLIYS